MGKGLLFFCCSCCILVLTIINLSVGPIVNNVVSDPYSNGDLGTQNCELYKDQKDTALNDQQKEMYQSLIDMCTRTKGMHDMEYTAFIFDIVIGFICGLIGLLHLFDLKKDFVSNTGLIGLICGVIGFVLTLVYVIFNGIVFTSNYADDYERDGDGVFAEQVTAGGTKYKCLYYDDSGNNFAGKAKFSDLNKKQYNYKHKFYDGVDGRCIDNDHGWISDCKDESQFDFGTYTTGQTAPHTSCSKLYAKANEEIKNKDIFDRFLTALILSLVVCLANIGLALFGFLLFRTPSDF
jgi:uncharacterized membrane protein (DUF485 family)